MRVLSRKTLREFWEKHADAKQPLKAWHAKAEKARWTSPREIKARYASASFVGTDRVVFNIAGHKYRLIAAVKYSGEHSDGSLFVRFIGTHKEYVRHHGRGGRMTTDILPIRDDDDHQAALAEIERLWAAEPGAPEADRLEVLSTLVEAYERAHHAIGPPDPVEAIKFRMEQIGSERGALAEILGSKARASEILNRRRRLTLPMIRSLNRELGDPGRGPDCRGGGRHPDATLSRQEGRSKAKLLKDDGEGNGEIAAPSSQGVDLANASARPRVPSRYRYCKPIF